mmetsp:Transcript_2250/g.4133  ORF Transcript_2250/g.4133 Transcript_2250/m.4133 type:complete len:208 (-) Transcript_2250:504-1127(-)|eukprot:CAMPEP_0197518674 /NCGR_PEP_ID=MMETSP1318-20131121/3902_1 /TAXON_ID=552666 /ORGANISM="Partenskyella glossopodia, Strain RCC365" /LENGTH=207 /DNA_ID=CAMNT_0043069201 /DNA_START=45 /DNA_END=668 /DNA_ORIENTATION=+
MPTRVDTKSNTITLKGSAQIVSEFFGYSINSILYQRGIYDPDLFNPVQKYKLRMMVTKDEGLSEYLNNVLGQLTNWLEKGMVKKLVVVIASVDSEETLERWVFDVDTSQDCVREGKGAQKSEKAVMKEIQAIIRQITSSVTFLPLLEDPCTFDLLIYTPNDCQIPEKWEESDPKYIAKSNEVRLRSFTTKIHKVETSVAYKADDDDD